MSPRATCFGTVCATAFGWVGIAWSRLGLVAVTLPQATEQGALAALPATAELRAGEQSEGLDVAALAHKLRRYFEGHDVTFDEPLDPGLGTAFQRRVWAMVRSIPRGGTRSYAEVARLVGSPGAARAVGQAMARNPCPVVVPCHRVVGSDGRLTGFGGGLPMKHRLLLMEGAEAAHRI